MSFAADDLSPIDRAVALTADLDEALGRHLHKPGRQEDLCFALWHPSRGSTRLTAVIDEVVWPLEDERVLQGNVAFTEDYLDRVLRSVPAGSGIAFMHGHLGPGWQDMSRDDVVAEHDRLAGQVAGRTRLPLVGMTRGTDGAWSARFWGRSAPRAYERLDAQTVRVVGSRMRLTFHPDDVAPKPTPALGETLSVWGATAHKALTRTRIGIVGLGNVGSLAAEALSRMGLARLTYIDHDRLEVRNLDRTHGATMADVLADLLKVQVAGRATSASHTADWLDLRLIPESLLSDGGYAAALDCDLLLSCVDRPLPRHVLNAMAYGHLIPVVDGGISARVKPDGTPLHIAWRIQSVGPGSACLVCLGALRQSDIALDREGKLDDPDYLAGLSEAERAAVARRNVFPFGMSVAAHQVLQAVGVITGLARIGGAGPQTYQGYPGEMSVERGAVCQPECGYLALTASAPDLGAGLWR
jgi:molybdopterin-synthase adenylyltransferase